MKKTFLLTSILLLSATWALAQYSSGSSATDQNTSDQNTGAYSGSSAGSQTSTDQANQGATDTSEPQSSGGTTQQSESSAGSMSSQQGSSDMSSHDMSSQAETSSGHMAAGGRMKTFQGCLSESNGKFHLTDKMGTTYELTGKTANLKAHVGHTIAVTGKASTMGEKQPGAMSGEQAGMEKSLQVSSFRHVSSNCKSSTGSTGSTGSSSNY